MGKADITTNVPNFAIMPASNGYMQYNNLVRQNKRQKRPQGLTSISVTEVMLNGIVKILLRVDDSSFAHAETTVKFNLQNIRECQ